jgi:hypothetical protein
MTTMSPEEGYRTFRGKCKEMCDALVEKDPTLKLVRGHYYEPLWGTAEQHWWCIDKDGKIIDPTVEQFPSRGMGTYEPFDGWVNCATCGRELREEEAVMASRYPVCNDRCYARLVGVEL